MKITRLGISLALLIALALAARFTPTSKFAQASTHPNTQMPTISEHPHRPTTTALD